MSKTEDTIRVWLSDARPLRNDDLRRLSTEEHSKASRFYFEKDRRLFVLGKRMARSIVSKEPRIAPCDLAFQQDQFGKPELAAGSGPSELSFNLAHRERESRARWAMGVRSGRSILSWTRLDWTRWNWPSVFFARARSPL